MQTLFISQPCRLDPSWLHLEVQSAAYVSFGHHTIIMDTNMRSLVYCLRHSLGLDQVWCSELVTIVLKYLYAFQLYIEYNLEISLVVSSKTVSR